MSKHLNLYLYHGPIYRPVVFLVLLAGEIFALDVGEKVGGGGGTLVLVHLQGRLVRTAQLHKLFWLTFLLMVYKLKVHTHPEENLWLCTNIIIFAHVWMKK